MPNLVKVFQMVKNKKITFISVSLDNKAQEGAWKAAVISEKMSWTNLSDLKGKENAVAKLYKI